VVKRTAATLFLTYTLHCRWQKYLTTYSCHAFLHANHPIMHTELRYVSFYYPQYTDELIRCFKRDNRAVLQLLTALRVSVSLELERKHF